ncbi:hypothetical protein EJB05_03741, partial [Eragrostis curvula]
MPSSERKLMEARYKDFLIHWQKTAKRMTEFAVLGEERRKGNSTATKLISDESDGKNCSEKDLVSRDNLPERNEINQNTKVIIQMRQRTQQQDRDAEPEVKLVGSEPPYIEFPPGLLAFSTVEPVPPPPPNGVPAGPVPVIPGM